jgi:large subunit ribosomal protein L4
MSPQAKTGPAAARKAPKLGAQGNVDLPAEIFGEPFHEALVYEAARAEQLALRRGTAASKTRGEVRGGGSKPWRQKGTGRARIGSSRAPHWTGGGAAFGPSPRGYTVKVNRKARRRAFRAALSLHAERDSIAVVDGASFDDPSTRKAVDALDGWDSQRPVLVLLDPEEDACARSFRNIDRVSVLPASEAGVVDVMGAASVVVSSAALERLTQS